MNTSREDLPLEVKVKKKPEEWSAFLYEGDLEDLEDFLSETDVIVRNGAYWGDSSPGVTLRWPQSRKSYRKVGYAAYGKERDIWNGVWIVKSTKGKVKVLAKSEFEDSFKIVKESN
jgi:hypothetical protein